jgi:hypothetical protein
MSRCGDCVHWQNPWTDDDQTRGWMTVEKAQQPRWGTCQKISLTYRRADLAEDVTAFTMDGSEFMADLYTRDDFGCTLHQPREPETHEVLAGYMNRPTLDGRVLDDLGWVFPIPVIYEQELVGEVIGSRIEGDEIHLQLTGWVEGTFPSLDIAIGRPVVSQNGIMTISGMVRGVTLIPLAGFPWDRPSPAHHPKPKEYPIMTALSAADRDRLLDATHEWYAALPHIADDIAANRDQAHDNLQRLLAAWHAAGYVLVPVAGLDALQGVAEGTGNLVTAMREAP